MPVSDVDRAKVSIGVGLSDMAPGSIADFTDPDGNLWLLQEVRA